MKERWETDNENPPRRGVQMIFRKKTGWSILARVVPIWW